jgi:PucR family transcriptional regulator, purine catabolism regulatory protein
MMYENTRIDRVLLSIAQNEEMKEIIMSTIEPLVQYDNQRNMDLIGTFIAYNRCHGNVSQTARLLNLHRQSLLYRLRKIESLTGLSLIDPDDLFLLDLSIKIWKMGLYETKEKQ